MANDPAAGTSVEDFMRDLAHLAQQPPALTLEQFAAGFDEPPAPASIGAASTAGSGMAPAPAAVAVDPGAPGGFVTVDLPDRRGGVRSTPAADPEIVAAAKKNAPTAAELAIGMAGLEMPPAPVADPPASAPAKPRKVVRFVEAERERMVPLLHPLECEGVVYDAIAVRRLNVSDYREHFAKPEGERGPFPCFFDGRGEPVPVEVLDALSFDDGGKVNEAYDHFLPASFRADPEP